jgi:L-lactate dehydrogenase complex protein LldG
MESTKSKQIILSKIRKALHQSVSIPFSKQETEGEIYPKPSDDLSVIFATEFTRLLGKFSYCPSKEDLAYQAGQLVREMGWSKVYCKEGPLVRLFDRLGGSDFQYTDDLSNCDVSITGCEALVARTGTIVLSAGLPHGRTASVYAPVHVCVALTSQLSYDISDALSMIRKRYQGELPSVISFATGPSRTADIEKTLVVGVHGPREVYCLLVEDGPPL